MTDYHSTPRSPHSRRPLHRSSFPASNVPQLQTVGYVCRLLRWQRNFPITSSTALGKVAEFDSELNRTPIRQQLGARSVIRGKKPWRTHGVRARNARLCSRDLYSAAKRKLSCRAPGPCLLTQRRQALLPHLQSLTPVARNSDRQDVNRAKPSHGVESTVFAVFRGKLAGLLSRGKQIRNFKRCSEGAVVRMIELAMKPNSNCGMHTYHRRLMRSGILRYDGGIGF